MDDEQHDLEGYRIDRYIPWLCDGCGRPVLVNDRGESRQHGTDVDRDIPCSTTQPAPRPKARAST